MRYSVRTRSKAAPVKGVFVFIVRFDMGIMTILEIAWAKIGGQVTNSQAA